MSEKAKIVNNVSLVCILVNVILSIAKFIVGFLGHSSAIITDAVNSSGDVISTIIIIIGNKISDKKADKEHPYGHEKFECIFMIIFTFLLAYISIDMLKEGISTIYSCIKDSSLINQLETPTMITVWISVITIIVKAIMTKITFIYAKKVNSMSLRADGKNHELDVITSIILVIALLFAMKGIWFADAVASIIGCGFLFKLVFELFIEAVNGLVDKSADNEINNKAKELALNIEGVENVDRMRSRQFGSRAYIDIDISVDGNISLKEAHEIAEKVHRNVQDNIDDVKHCMVHVNPSQNA